jgi:hypothetical protein
MINGAPTSVFKMWLHKNVGALSFFWEVIVRDDIAKVSVERERWPKYSNRQKPCHDPLEELPLKERMKDRYMETRYQSDHLNPLKGWVRKQIGRPWNKAFSELCENLRLDSTIQRHVREHVFDFVDTPSLIRGVLHNHRGPLFGERFRYGAAIAYVDPCDGILKPLKDPRLWTKRELKQSKAKQAQEAVAKGALVRFEGRFFHRYKGFWFEWLMKDLPPCFQRWDEEKQEHVTHYRQVFDKNLGDLVSKNPKNLRRLYEAYGRLAYAAERRQVDSKMCRKLDAEVSYERAKAG